MLTSTSENHPTLAELGRNYRGTIKTSLMGKWSSSVIGWEVTISAWRHINIAWKHKLRKGSLDLELETEIMSPVHMLQAGHSAYTENHAYGEVFTVLH